MEILKVFLISFCIIAGTGMFIFLISLLIRYSIHIFMNKRENLSIRYISFKKFKEIFEQENPQLIRHYKGSFGDPFSRTYIHANIIRMNGYCNIFYFWDYIKGYSFLYKEWDRRMRLREDELRVERASQVEETNQLLNQGASMIERGPENEFSNKKITHPECRRLNEVCIESDSLLKDID